MHVDAFSAFEGAVVDVPDPLAVNTSAQTGEHR